MKKRKLSKNTAKRLPIKCTYIDKNHFNLNSVWSEIMSLKSDQLELGFSIYVCIASKRSIFLLIGSGSLPNKSVYSVMEYAEKSYG